MSLKESQSAGKGPAKGYTKKSGREDKKDSEKKLTAPACAGREGGGYNPGKKDGRSGK